MLINRLCRDPELKIGQSGQFHTTFTVAINNGVGDNRRTEWLTCSAFEQFAELVCKYLKKGSLYAVENRIQYGSYEKKTASNRT